MSVCMKIYKKELFFKAIQGVQTRLEQFEDLAYCYGPIIDAQSVYVERKSYYHYRNNPNSTTRKKQDDRFGKVQKSFMTERHIYNNYGSKYLQQFDFVATKFYYYHLWHLIEEGTEKQNEFINNLIQLKNDNLSTEILENSYKSGMGRKYDVFFKRLYLWNERAFWYYCRILRYISLLMISLKSRFRTVYNFLGVKR